MSTITGMGHASYMNPVPAGATYGSSSSGVYPPGLVTVSGQAGDQVVMDINRLPLPTNSPISMQALAGSMSVGFTLLGGTQLERATEPAFAPIWANETAVAAGTIVPAPIQFFVALRIKFEAAGTIAFYGYR